MVFLEKKLERMLKSQFDWSCIPLTDQDYEKHSDFGEERDVLRDFLQKKKKTMLSPRNTSPLEQMIRNETSFFSNLMGWISMAFSFYT